jgi:hypothetical protein
MAFERPDADGLIVTLRRRRLTHAQIAARVD